MDIKDVLPAGLFAVPKNWLAQGRVVSLQPERFLKMSKCYNIQKIITHTHTYNISHL